jgi:hypothetical protein
MMSNAACLQVCIDNDPGSSATLFQQWAACVTCSCVVDCSIAAGTCP